MDGYSRRGSERLGHVEVTWDFWEGRHEVIASPVAGRTEYDGDVRLAGAVP